ncbi:MAG: FAD binding domain-containing protein [Acidobacteria bacterium]|nr:FAD binding domain-containing protein [Acidobacteriota bacterium]
MKAFTNVNPRTLEDAVSALTRSRASGARAVVSGGGSDLLGLIKERLVQPDIVVNLKTVAGLSNVRADARATTIGGLITLDALSREAHIRRDYQGLAEAAASVGTPQIRNVGTLAGNVCQRPWCWYLRNGYACYKNGGDRCFASSGENQYHAIFSQGPSYIVHPSDTAPALVALDARFRVVGPRGERLVNASEFFVLPRVDPARENVLQDDEILAEIVLPPAVSSRRSTYAKILDREAWTHALVSAAVVLDMDGDVCRRARIVLGGVAPVPWDRPRAAGLLEGQRVTPELAAAVAEAAVSDARPLAKNGYKVPLTRGLVGRTVLALARQ